MSILNQRQNHGAEEEEGLIEDELGPQDEDEGFPHLIVGTEALPAHHTEHVEE